MKLRVKKILKWLALGILGVIALTGGFVMVFHDDIEVWIANRVQAYLSEMEYGDLEIESMDLALFGDLPNLSMELKEARFYEEKKPLREPDQPPIFDVEQILLSFDAVQLVRNNKLVVTYFGMEDGVVELFTYHDGTTNLEKAFSTSGKEAQPGARPDTVAVRTPETDPGHSPPKKPPLKGPEPELQDPPLQISLEDIHLENILLKYNNPRSSFASEVSLTEVHGEILLGDRGLSCDLSALFEIKESTRLPSLVKQGPMKLRLGLDFFETSQELVVHRGDLSFEKFSVDLKGTYEHNKDNYMDLIFDASSNDLAFLSEVIQEDILHQNRSSVNKANIVLKGRIHGELKANIPVMALEFGVKDLSIQDPSGKVTIRDLGFEGRFHSGDKDDFSKAELELRGIKGQLSGGAVSGAFFLRNFQQPYIKSSVKAVLDLKGYDALFNLPDIDSLGGRLEFMSDIDGILNLEGGHDMDSVGHWSLTLQEVGFFYHPFQKKISGLSGVLEENRNDMSIENLRIVYDSSVIGINGHIKNLYHFLFNKEQDLAAELQVNASPLYTSDFITEPGSSALIDDRISNLRMDVAITASDYDAYDAYLPDFDIELRHLSMDLDSLPGIPKLQGSFGIREWEEGFKFDLHRIRAQLPVGTISLDGVVGMPEDFQTLEYDLRLSLDRVPQEYLLDFIRDLKNEPLLGAKGMSEDQMTLFSMESGVKGSFELLPFEVRNTRITDGDIRMRMPDTTRYELENLNLEMEGLSFERMPESGGVSGIKWVSGRLSVDTIRSPVLDMPIAMSFSGVNDTLNVSFSILRDSLLPDRGSLFLDVSETPPSFDLSYDLKEVDLASAISEYTKQNLMEGRVDVSLQLHGRGTGLDTLLPNLKGKLRIDGDSLMLNGLDLDDLLRKYKRSQNFNLADVSAFMIAGPFGAVVTKGSDFTSLITADLNPGDQTIVVQLLADWHIDQGIIRTEDVAFSTKTGRIAFNGAIDYERDSIPGLTVFVVDKKGCSLMEQRIYGKMADLKMDQLEVARTLLGSVANLFDALVGKDCDPVYEGAVPHPNQ